MNFHLTAADWITVIGLLVTIELGVVNGTIKLTNAIPDAWVPRVQAWCGILAAIGGGIITALSRFVGALLIAFALSVLLIPGGAQAQIRIKTPQQIAADVKHVLDPSSPASAPSKPGACDITLFTNLNIANVVTDIQNCIGSVVAGGAAPFVTDIQAALDSATAAKDGTAVSCLAPALAIATAAMGKPAVPAVMSTDGTTVVTPEVPAVYPGPILIFQKYREFVTAGGPSNCKTAVQSTINGTMASAL